MKTRESFAYVVTVEGSFVKLNLLDAHRGQVAAHRDGVSSVTDIGNLFAVEGGIRLLVLRVKSLSFAEPREAHRAGIGSTHNSGEPLRHLEATVMGTIVRSSGGLIFTPDSLVSPPLGAEAYPLSNEELTSILRTAAPGSNPAMELSLGNDIRGGSSLRCNISDLLGRHVAVLGSTGQGKSCFTAAILQQLSKLNAPRIIVFDINGEYADALEPHLGPSLKSTTIGSGPSDFKIPYYALGRHGLARLFLPSEKTQRPALSFALEHLSAVQWFPKSQGAALAGSNAATLFDDCRPDNAREAWSAIEKLRAGTSPKAMQWPHMSALACLVAESHALKPVTRGGATIYERDGFQYGNVSPLITRIRRCLDDPMFTSVVDIMGGPSKAGGHLDWNQEGVALCNEIFGCVSSDWKVHIVDLRGVAHDLMPLVLGSLLELLAVQIFRSGQAAVYPTMLVLEEAHHYLRSSGDNQDESSRNALAYERLAKEGRKFGLSLWLSTQRPAEVSSTVLSQCGTWVVFRLTSDHDLKAVASAGEWVDRQELGRIAGLPRRQALVFGSSVAIPVRIEAPAAKPPPKSSDPDFRRWV